MNNTLNPQNKAAAGQVKDLPKKKFLLSEKKKDNK